MDKFVAGAWQAVSFMLQECATRFDHEAVAIGRAAIGRAQLRGQAILLHALLWVFDGLLTVLPTTPKPPMRPLRRPRLKSSLADRSSAFSVVRLTQTRTGSSTRSTTGACYA